MAGLPMTPICLGSMTMKNTTRTAAVSYTHLMGVFIETGLTLMDCYPVAEKWLAECRLNQYPDGRMANIAPPNARPGYMTPMLCIDVYKRQAPTCPLSGAWSLTPKP